MPLTTRTLWVEFFTRIIALSESSFFQKLEKVKVLLRVKTFSVLKPESYLKPLQHKNSEFALVFKEMKVLRCLGKQMSAITLHKDWPEIELLPPSQVYLP